MTILFALALIPLVGMAGAAVDYTRATRAGSTLQAAADAAALHAIRAKVGTDVERKYMAEALFKANSAPHAFDTLVTDVTSKKAIVTATAHVETSLLKVMQINAGRPSDQGVIDGGHHGACEEKQNGGGSGHRTPAPPAPPPVL